MMTNGRPPATTTTMNRFLSRSAWLLASTLATPAFAADPPPDPHAGHDMSKMAPATDAAIPMPMSMPMDMPMQSALGGYAMTRDASGTSWQPDATSMGGLHLHEGGWKAMLHGFVNVIHDDQRGPRGDTKNFSQSMLMLMADRPLGPGTFGVKTMLSLDPAFGKSGYPLLFQTGETADGQTALVDRQHPHDFFMELSGSYSVKLGDSGQDSAYLYAGLPGEPALGPPAFMHRFSGMRNPEAPLTHHWLDSTHITFGVVTVGASHGPLKLEGSWFNGREPDQSRWNIETRRFDSWSARVSWNPLPQLSMQVSHGDLKSPEQLEPDVRVRRTTASASLHLKPGGNDWGTTLAWGQNEKSGHGERRRLPGWLLESTAVIGARHTVFGRAEQLHNDELFAGSALAGQTFRIRKLSLGYIYDFAKTGPVAWGLGASAATYRQPDALDASYGRHPRSFMVFLQGRL